MFIANRVSDGKTYAYLAEAYRDGSSVKKKYVYNLGRVLDAEKGFYRNKERGVYSYDLATNTFGVVPPDFKEPPRRKPTKYLNVSGKRRSRLCLEFGTSFFIDKALQAMKLYPVIDSIDYANKDTLHAVIFFYILSKRANDHAQVWYELNYAKYLFPNATMASQKISECLQQVGLEESKRAFFKSYYSYIKTLKLDPKKLSWLDCSFADGKEGEGILIDSTGLPNSCHLPITAISNHNGEIHEEIRLIYVVQQGTGLPLFFDYVAGNVIDASTIRHTITTLKKYGVNVDFSILDAGYFNHKNADVLIDAGIAFMSSVHSNFKVYTSIVAEYRSSLECRENFLIYNGRFYYMKCVPCKIGEKEDKDAFAYLGLDLAMRDQQKFHLRGKITDKKMTDGEAFDSISEYGLFMLISTVKMTPLNAISMYYTRNQIEEVFGICQGDSGKPLPLYVDTEKSFRGHLLISFIASTILLLLREKLSVLNMTVESAFDELSHHQGLVYPDAIVPSITVKQMNDIYKLFKIKCPDEIPIIDDTATPIL